MNVKEISNTKLLVHLHYQYGSATMGIFDISKKGKVNRIHAFPEVQERNMTAHPLSIILFFFVDSDTMDVAYNSRRGLLGAMPIVEKISCHLFNIEYSRLKSQFGVKLLKKLKWHPQESTRESGNYSI